METSGTNFPTALRAPDLAPVVLAEGPFATVELTTEAAVENAARLSEARWRALRQSLADAGAPEAVLEAVDPLVPDAHLQGGGLTVVANAGGVLLAEHHADRPRREVARWAPLPALVPLLLRRQATPPVLAVVTDRRGADLVALRPGTFEEVRREAGGDDFPVRKVSAGGWSQRRYQERAENTWEHNAEDVAAQAAKLAEQVNARLVLVAGDVRAVQLLQESLPQRLLDAVQVIDGGRAADGSLERLSEDLRPFIDEAVEADTRALAEKFREEAGQQDRAVEGVAETLGALAMAQVEVLLINEELATDDERTAWFGPEPAHLALDRNDLEGLGVDAPVEGRLLDVAVRAALGTSAGVRVVPRGLTPAEGLGGLLRWSSAG
jgi:hypothetical protein